MSEIDDKIVSITFDNDNFEKKLAQTIASLDALSETIKMAGAREGLSQLGEAAEGFDVSGMADAIDNISSKFSTLGAIGFTVIQNLTTAAMGFVEGVLTKISEPILVGGKRRAENIEQAKFLFEGLGMDIEATMASAREAVLGTAFGLDSAAKAAAQLGGSGMRAGKEMTGTLRGIAGLSAMTGTSFEEMADIFVSAAGKGTVSGYELQRIAYRGVNAAAVLAKQMGTTEAEIRRMASEGEISFQEFAAAMNDAFGEHATKANQTYAGSLANLRAAFSRMGAQFFGPNLEQQRDLFNAITPKVDELAKALSPLISAFVAIKRLAINNLIKIFEGLDFSKLAFVMPSISQGVITLFATFAGVIKSIKEAFKDVFPADFGNIVVVIAQAFQKLVNWIKMGDTTLAMLTSVFHGVFSAIAIGIEIIKETADLFRDLFLVITDALGIEFDGGGILHWFASLGETIFDLKKALVDDGGIADFFDRINIAIATFMEDVKGFESPFEFLQKVKDTIMNLFDTSEGVPGAEQAGSAFGRVGDRIDHIRGIFESVGKALQRVGNALEPVVKVIDWIWENLKTWFGELGDKLAAVMDAGDFNALVDMLNVTLVGGILYYLRKFIDGGMQLDFTSFMGPIKGILDSVKDTLKAMQLELKAKALLKIAYALGIMTVSIVALSLIDSAALTKALAAITVAFGQLAGMMKLMDEIVADPKSAAKIGILAGSMMLLATAMGILSVSIKILSTMGWEELAKGLVGVGGGMALMVKSMNLITKDPTGLIRTGVAMIAIAVAMRILANAMQAFATMDWGEMAKGLVGVGGGLAFLVNAMNKIDAKDMISAGIGIIAIAVGMRILANAMQAFATMSWGEIAKGLISVGLALGIIVLLTNTMPAGGMVGIGVGLIGVAIALRIMGEAIEKIGEMDLGTLAKGLGAIAVTMLILAVATNAMTGALAGAAAMLIVSASLLVMAKVLEAIGSLSLKELAIGLGGIAAVLLLLGLGSAALSPVIPTMYALGAALLMLGGGFALFGVAAMLVVKALEMLVKLGSKGMQALEEVLMITARRLPMLMGALVAGFIEGSQEILKALPTLVDTIKVLFSHILDTITELAPKMGEALTAILVTALKMLAEVFPQFVDTGIAIVKAIMEGLDANIEEFTEKAIDILIKFLETITENMQDIVDAGVDLVLALLEGIGSRADDLAMAGLNLLLQILAGIAGHIDRAIGAATSIVVGLIQGLGTAALQLIAAGANLIIQLVYGMTSNMIRVANAVTTAIQVFLYTMGANAQLIVDAGFNVLTQFLSGLTDNVTQITTDVATMIGQFITAIGDSADIIMTAGLDALIDFLTGVRDTSETATKAFAKTAVFIATNIANAIVWTTKQLIDVLVDFLNGMAAAIEEGGPRVRSAFLRLAKAIAKGFVGGLLSKDSLQIIKDGAVSFAEKAKHYMTHPWEVFSPSRFTYRLGNMVAAGFANALLDDKSGQRAALKMSNGVRDSFQKAFNNMPSYVPAIGDVNPVITPVLDLSKVSKESKNIDKMMSARTITPDVSLERARALALVSTNQNGSEETPVPAGPTELKFEQNIYSPTALSVADIYRQTKSQIALAKEEFDVA